MKYMRKGITRPELNTRNWVYKDEVTLLQNANLKIQFSIVYFVPLQCQWSMPNNSLSGKYTKFEKSCSPSLISFFGQNGTKHQ